MLKYIIKARGKLNEVWEYIKKVNERRQGLGFASFWDDGLPIDTPETLRYCEDLIRGEKKYRPQ